MVTWAPRTPLHCGVVNRNSAMSDQSVGFVAYCRLTVDILFVPRPRPSFVKLDVRGAATIVVPRSDRSHAIACALESLRAGSIAARPSGHAKHVRPLYCPPALTAGHRITNPSLAGGHQNARAECRTLDRHDKDRRRDDISRGRNSIRSSQIFDLAASPRVGRTDQHLNSSPSQSIETAIRRGAQPQSRLVSSRLCLVMTVGAKARHSRSNDPGVEGWPNSGCLTPTSAVPRAGIDTVTSAGAFTGTDRATDPRMPTALRSCRAPGCRDHDRFSRLQHGRRSGLEYAGCVY